MLSRTTVLDTSQDPHSSPRPYPLLVLPSVCNCHKRTSQKTKKDDKENTLNPKPCRVGYNTFKGGRSWTKGLPKALSKGPSFGNTPGLHSMTNLRIVKLIN
jgi:hypothetical protein